jgi:hypothetical protein
MSQLEIEEKTNAQRKLNLQGLLLSNEEHYGEGSL